MKRPNTQHSARAHNPNATPAPRVPRAGFTLPELLIAITVFLSVAGGIALLFTQSIRTVKVGHQNIEVNEHIRAAMDLLETDLTQAFTSRDYGDYYTFYGTPIGMTFVGLVRPNRDAGQPNLSRVTYVLYTGNNRQFTSYEDYANVPDNAPVTYDLLRFVEPEADNLETLQIKPLRDDNGKYQATVPWPHPSDPEPGEGDPANGIYWELRDAAESSMVGSLEERQRCDSQDCIDEIVKAKKREIWLRMLTGEPRSNPNLPPFWQEDYPPNHPDAPSAPSYRDYVLAEDIVLVQEVGANELFKENVLASNPAAEPWSSRAMAVPAPFPFQPIFSYGACCVNGQPSFYPFWNDQRNMVGVFSLAEMQAGIAIPEGHAAYAFGSPMAPRIPVVVNVNLNFLRASPYAGAPDLFRGFTKQIDLPSGYTRTALTAG